MADPSDIFNAYDDRFGHLPGFKTQRLFGGTGFYSDGRIFGFDAEGTLYLKTNAETLPLFLQADAQPFIFKGKEGEAKAMSYYTVPAAFWDDDQAAEFWVNLALKAAYAAPAKSSKAKQNRVVKPSRIRKEPWDYQP
ncbi:MAG: TfoX/Sxy family protein [Asticcacaulis sp.]